MKEYIKLFEDLQSADGYLIEDIPFTCTVKPAEISGATQNLRCNVEDKMIKVEGGNMDVVPASPLNTILHLSGGTDVELTGTTITSAMTSSYKSNLVGVEIGRNVTSIGNGTFSGCTRLTGITIPDSVTSIGSSAFRGCTSLSAITIPSGVTGINSGVFSGCTSLSTVMLNSNSIVSKTYSSGSTIGSIFGTQVTEYIIGSGVTSVGEYAFSGCTSLSSVTIPDSVTSIGQSAFSGVSGKIRFNKVYSTFTNKINSLTTFTYSIEFNIQEMPSGYNISSMLSVGSSKATITYNIYTDLEECKTQALALAHEYTIVNVYHIDGSPWE